MTTSQLPLNSETFHMPETKSGERNLGQLTEEANPRHQINGWTLALTMLGYFLGLASIAVVVIGGQFPWFTLTPTIILLSIAYFRHLEVKFKQESSD